jgi:hypothetical protein
MGEQIFEEWRRHVEYWLMDPEVDQIRRSDYKIGIGYVKGFNRRHG